MTEQKVNNGISASTDIGQDLFIEATGTVPSSFDQLSLAVLSGALENLRIRRSTTELTRRSAVQQAIAIPEIREHILEHLPYGDLLRARRINRHFATIIDTSPTLQRNLYLSPLAGSEEKEVTHNLHPALTMDRTTTSGSYMLYGVRGPDKRTWYEVAILTHKRCISMTPSDSVLQKMLISQPPITKALLYIERAARNKRSKIRPKFETFVVHNDGGITFGQLYDVANSRMPKCRDSEITYSIQNICLEADKTVENLRRFNDKWRAALCSWGLVKEVACKSQFGYVDSVHVISLAIDLPDSFVSYTCTFRYSYMSP